MRLRLWISTLFISFLYSNFIGMNNGARSLAMGDSYVALCDNPTAIFYNPAGLVKNNDFHVSTSRQNLYGISELNSDMLAISFPTSILGLGIAAQQISLEKTYSEKIFFISSAGTIRIRNIPIRFGASLKYESAKVEDYADSKNPSNIDLDIGLLVDINKNLFVGYSVRSLLQPTFKFISSEDKLNRIHLVGICYKWKESVNFLLDYFLEGDNSHLNMGSEIWFYDVFAARVGMMDDKLTIGFGLEANSWVIDTAVLANEDLGSTYRVSIGYRVKNQK